MVILLAFLLLLFYGAGNINCSTVNHKNMTDMLSLLDFKAATNDPTGALRSWDRSVHYYNSTGVRCSQGNPGRVAALQLPGFVVSHFIGVTVVRRVGPPEHPSALRLLPLQPRRMADNQWMYSGFIRRNRVTSEWIAKTDVYLKEIFRRPMRIIPPYPCARCARRHRRNQTDMSEHLRTHGYMPNFDMPPINIAEQDRGREEVMRQRIDGYEDDGVRDMLDDVIVAETGNATPSENEPEEPEATAKAFLEVLASSKKPLYAGAKISQLDAISQLIAVKAEYGCSQKCFEAFLGVWANSVPEGHELPKSMYDTKKIMKALSMDYEKIDVCPKNCLLFRHEYADDKYCRQCGSSRYIEVVSEDGEKKQLTIPVKVLRYLDFIKRLQRLFITKESAKMMKWHKEGIRYNPKKIIHPSEGEAWKSFDEEYPEEAAEAGNVRLAISGDGLNPYEILSSSPGAQGQSGPDRATPMQEEGPPDAVRGALCGHLDILPRLSWCEDDQGRSAEDGHYLGEGRVLGGVSKLVLWKRRVLGGIGGSLV
ncbi:uncharacterized protein [Aegilops tauschii subsp. strangulata]